MNKPADNHVDATLKDQLALLQKKARHLTIVNEFATSLLLQNTIEEIVWSITTNVMAKLGFVDCVVYLVDEDRQVLVQKAAYGSKNPEAHEIINHLEISKGLGYGTTFNFSVPAHPRA